MKANITSDMELMEVINQFPVLEDFLKYLDIDRFVIKEGETIKKFFDRKYYDEDDIEFMLKKMNKLAQQQLEGKVPQDHILKQEANEFEPQKEEEEED